jgi:Holliday junction resolvasome RuvABC endonuclease subunit
MAIVCGIDPSLTSAGVAVLQDGKPVHTAHHGYKGTKAMAWDARMDRVIWVHNRIQESIPDDANLVVIEDIPEHGQIMPSTRDRSALWGLLYAHLRKNRKLPVAVLNPATLKVWTTGRGRADKADIVTEVQSWWPDLAITCDDEADAVALATAGAFHLGDPMPFDVKSRHHTGLEKVSWP